MKKSIIKKNIIDDRKKKYINLIKNIKHNRESIIFKKKR